MHKGQAGESKPERGEPAYINISKESIKRHKFMTLAVDVMFISRIPFFMTLSRDVRFMTVELIPRCTTIQCVIMQLLLRRVVFICQTLLIDGEF